MVVKPWDLAKTKDDLMGCDIGIVLNVTDVSMNGNKYKTSLYLF